MGQLGEQPVSIQELLRRLQREDGFTVVEMVVAATVLLTSMLSLAYTATLGFTDTALARQRQSASGLANQAIEQIRALPFDTLTKGLSSNDPTIGADTSITTCGSARCYGGEQIPMSGYAAGTTLSPLVPHLRTVTVGPTVFTVSAYVTYFQNATTISTYRATAVVSWAGGDRPGAAHRVTLQTIVYSPSGCLSTATHPYAAPCQPFLYAAATSGQGSVGITGTIDGVTFDRASVWLAGGNVNQQIEQTSSQQGHAWTGGVSLDPAGSGDEQYSGRTQATSGADNDPSTPGNEYDSQTVGPQSLGAVITVGDAGGSHLTLTPSSGDTGTTTSTTSAGGANACSNAQAVPQMDGLLCGASESLQAGTSSIVLALVVGGTDLGSASLVSLGPSPSDHPGFAFANRDAAPETGVCATTSGDGCVHAEATRTIGQLTLAGLPAAIPDADLPAGWAGYLVRITSSTDSASAEAGVGTVAPAATGSATFSLWNGSGYTTCTLPGGSCVDGVGQLSVAAVHVEDSGFAGGNLEIDVTSQLAPGSPVASAVSAVCDPACPNTRTAAQVTSPGPMTGDIRYRVAIGGNTVADLTIQVTPGALSAKASYQQSPGGSA